MMIGSRWGILGAAAVLAVGLAACTTLSSVEMERDGAVAAAIEVGDRISIVDTRGEAIEIVVTAVGVNSIEGVADDDAPRRIATADIVQLRKRHAAAGKTAALAAGLVLGGLFIGAASSYGSVSW